MGAPGRGLGIVELWDTFGRCMTDEQGAREPADACKCSRLPESSGEKEFEELLLFQGVGGRRRRTTTNVYAARSEIRK